jgi:sugar/nucleoside kinase (ribokinase family)
VPAALGAEPAPVDVVTIGEAMVLFIADEPGPLVDVGRYVRGIAGAETNVAIGLTRLGFNVRWVSRLGDDSFGRYLRQGLQREGLDLSAVRTDTARSTGFMLKSMATDGSDPQTEYHRRDSAASALSLDEDFDAAVFTAARHLHATGICPALSASALALTEHAMRTMRAAGRTVSFDPNLRPALWPDRAAMVATINRLAASADWVLPGLDEGGQLTGRDTPEGIAAFYADRGAQAVVVKLGPAGAYYRVGRGDGAEAGFVSGVAVDRVVDTVGAGDGFAVGLISARLEGLGWPEAVARGNWIGARQVQVVGDMDGLPLRDALSQPSAPHR